MATDADVPVIDLEALAVRFGQYQALRGVSLSIPSGAVGLVGRNGAGKSTLMKVLLGLVEPESGGGRVLGVDIRGNGRLLRASVGYMPENDAFVLGMWGIEQVALAAELCGIERREALRRAHEVLAYVDLGEARYRNVEQYSTGMRQRLKLAIALAHDPKLLLLDEPTVGLDPPSRKRMLDLIEDLVHRRGKSLVISTHLLGDIEHTCDYVVMIDQGRVITSGPIEEVLRRQTIHYHLRWDGAGREFLAALEGEGGSLIHDLTAGARSSVDHDGGDVRIAMPARFEPRRFFEVAERQGCVLMTMETDHGDLEEVYHRLLEQEAGA